ncbi:HNH endonuclease [Klebsiella pneumoniae]|uniref:HNH endonuclease n=1 Tax=Klebsiella pneumoniae TaxID=573 RepID=UPI001CBB9B7B|nr:HNH endonuclease signature motif containing protein [Klebsiella pneumoniae]EKX7637460.1 HNH endonuclease [Klebsiella pneumoniae]ELA1308041.1 HNH endonuclease [Klebsiella pneumoniae]MBZ1696856.1 HNH endonuclease [Klebsiella pneumoniae]HDZ2531260.1 HNH endonuclease [Klebsiella pneumoniae]HDZ2539732.1 HNH endonuclease [Klebsiella pneumoniae]
MPPRTPIPCRARGCAELVTNGSGYCDAHKGDGWKRHQSGRSRQQRGYGSKWDKLRPVIWARDKGLCQNHLRSGVVVPAYCVDHIKPKAHGGTDELDNLECLCKACHATKTARERLG